ncbi:uncharacterized protein LOC9309734 isoform X3 [Arabidopsis lyrata subsp. lyrata]|uniref:uncharacterized protein LOC9309734 isoform X3 n=1 Tax=Arabidopsis lyrata subsp. lyrata TaxID=81972 RepID=UPI000A29D1D1|nr:uncharacterized protein LOC9309734 isoform X3 [Arabidopsis lyrata subsp. lyrata]|eukprot:XP_020879036.1 uncharacterized protein LOC9309734 isoform X3 [Arabidopsis lyrata subsp. lyrata]
MIFSSLLISSSSPPLPMYSVTFLVLRSPPAPPSEPPSPPSEPPSPPTPPEPPDPPDPQIRPSSGEIYAQVLLLPHFTGLPRVHSEHKLPSPPPSRHVPPIITVFVPRRSSRRCCHMPITTRSPKVKLRFSLVGPYHCCGLVTSLSRPNYRSCCGPTPLFDWTRTETERWRPLGLCAGLGFTEENICVIKSQLFQPPSQKIEAFLSFSDAEWLQSMVCCGLGWSFKDPLNGKIHHGSFSRPFVSSVLVAEALALKAAIKAAIKAALLLGVSRLACVSDCQELVLLPNTDGHANELDSILADCDLFVLYFCLCMFILFQGLKTVELTL